MTIKNLIKEAETYLSKESGAKRLIKKEDVNNEALFKEEYEKSGAKTFYYIDKIDLIVLCIEAFDFADYQYEFEDRYWLEAFDLEDYKWATKWLKREIVYSDYLEFIEENLKRSTC